MRYLPLMLILFGCAAETNVEAFRDVPVPLEVTPQDRQECASQGMEAGRGEMPPENLQQFANVGAYEAFVDRYRQQVATKAYRDCLKAKGYRIQSP